MNTNEFIAEMMGGTNIAIQKESVEKAVRKPVATMRRQKVWVFFQLSVLE